MKLYTGQIPLFPLIINVTRLLGTQAADLTAYTSVQVLMKSPTLTNVDLSGGTVITDQLSSGIVKYDWPDTSLFPTPGDYKVQVVLDKTGAHDLTSIGVIEVFRSLESA